MESTETIQSTVPTASSLTTMASKIVSKVPSIVHSRKRSGAGLPRSVAFGQVPPGRARSFHMIALITCR